MNTQALSERRLKVAVLNRRFAQKAGGAEGYSVALVERLRDRHDLHVFAQEIDHVPPGVTYHKVWRPFVRPRWLNQLWYATATWWLTRRGFDVVHSHEHVWHGNVQTLHVRLLKFNLLHDAVGWRRWRNVIKLWTSPRLLAYWWLESARVRPRAGRVVVAVSETLREELSRCYPASLACTQVLPPGVTLPYADLADVQTARSLSVPGVWRELGLGSNDRLVLFVANDFHRKGLDALLQAMALLEARVHLAIAGASRDMAIYRSRCAALGLENRVHFLGAQTDMSRLYLAADVLAHPTLGDSYGMVVVEAMAHGLPVVVSAAPWCGAAARLRDGEDAFVLGDPRGSGLLAGLLEKVLDAGAPVQAMRARAHQYAQGMGWSVIADGHARLYAKAALESGAAAPICPQR
jgi:glycosyltransferase involved in cell wall biosynthesis